MSKEKKEEKAAKPARVVAKPTRKSFEGKRKRRTAMPMKERPKERRPSTVKGIIASFNDQAKTNDAAIVNFNSGVSSLYENTLIYAKKQKEAIAAFNANVREQINENTKNTVAFSTNVAALYETIVDHARKQEEAIAAFNANVREQINENTEYVKNFYG